MDAWGLEYLVEDLMNPEQRGLNLELDLNNPIQSSFDLSLGLSTYANYPEVQTQVHRWPQQQISNAFEALDDEVSIISAQEFARARENSRRNHSRGKRELIGQDTGVLEGCDAEANLCTRCKRSMQDGCQPYKNKVDDVYVIPESPQVTSLSEEPILSCPICMGHLTEPTATKCGHIFCKECLLKSLKSLRSKCPTCRQKVGKRSIFRIYLPTTY